jgi:D-alanyl-D-alanine carboxypeptidase/D-alanyl-D-alanine-endopeptidase (penicillin-binding protein 4)
MSSLLGELSPCSGDVLLEEGAGLSRRDLVTAASIVALLSWMSHHKCADIFRESLPVAGMDGTLRGRMKNTLAASNVRAKTGTLKFVNALSGYATTAAGERLAFSILLNNYSPSDGSDPASSSLDSILGMLVSFTGHS